MSTHVIAARPRRTLLLASTVLVPVVAALAAPAHAQQQDARTEVLPVLVVSPTGTPAPVEQIASSLTVITAADIEREQRRTVPDALATVPGLNIVQTGGPGGQTSVFMRGTNSNHTKVLIDGIDVSDPSNPNRSFDFGQLLTNDIERIEVLRGPQSGLYGADAIGGVISIYTKKGEGPPRVTGMIEGGSHGTFNQAAGVSGGQDRINYAFNVAHFRASDTPVTPQELLPPGRRAIGNFYDNMTYSGRLGVDVNEYLSFNSIARYTEGTLRYTADSGWPSYPNAAQSTSEIRQLYTRNEAVVTLFDGAFRNYFGVNTTNYWNTTRSPSAAATFTDGERVKYDWRGVATLAPWQTLVVGADFETENLRTQATTAENGNKAVYVESQSQFADRVFLVANVRSDHNDRFGEHTTWRVAPAVIVPGTETKLKASYGTGFKAPTLNQLFVDLPDYGFYANRNLKPEESTGYDIGFEQPLFNNRVRVGSTYFRNDITNLIASNATFTSNINIGKAITEGNESFISAVVTDRILLRADYTYTRAVDATTGLELLRRPKDKWSLSAIWKPIDPLTVTATVLHIGSFVDGNRDFSVPRLLTKDYTTVNVAADYVVNDQVKLFGRIDNLFDVRYQNPTGFLQPGLGVFGGIKLANFGVR